MNPIVLENHRIRAVFNARTGALMELVNRVTNWGLIRRGELGLSFRMLVPVPGERTNVIFGDNAFLASSELSDDGRALTLEWTNLVDEHGGAHDVDFTGVVHLEDEGLRFEGMVQNRSSNTVEVVAWPCVGDITPSTKDKSLREHRVEWESLVTMPLSPGFPNQKGYWGTLHPAAGGSTNGNLFSLLAEEDQGFYIAVHETTNREMVHWFYELKPGYVDSHTGLMPSTDELAGIPARLDLMMQHFSFVQPGESYSLSPVAIRPYAGPWQSGIDMYRQWRKTWFTAPRRPAWVDEVHSWLQIQICSSEDRVNFRYEDLPAIARQCKDNGIKAIQVTGWAEGGQDRGNPSHNPDPALGTLEELRQAIAECEEIGVKVILFTKWTWWDKSQPSFETEGYKHVAISPYGDHYPAGGYQYFSWTQLAGLNTRPLVATCTCSPAWRTVACEEFQKVLDTGAPGMLFDECQHHYLANYCFSPDHGHRVPAYLYGADVQLAREFHELSDKDHPEFLYAGELCYDLEMQVYHLIYTRFGQGHVPGYRYLDPSSQIMMAVTGFDDRNQLNKCLEYRYVISYEPYNFKGRPGDAPLTVAYGRKVDDLRRRYRSFLWDGEFRSHLGATVTVEGKPTTDFSVFVDRQTGKRAVVVCNLDPDKTVSATVELEAGTKVDLVHASPEEPEARPCDGAVSIPPRSATVVMEQ